MNNVFVYCEIEGTQVQEVSQELLTKGRKLANELGVELHAIVAGTGIKGNVEDQILPYGVDKLFVFDGEGLFPYTSAPHTDILVNLFKEEQPQICLMGATVIGRDLGPRVSSSLTSGLTADCTELEIGSYEDKKSGKTYDNLLYQIRPAFGGNIVATIVNPEHRPQMATVRSGVMQKAIYEGNAKNETVYPEVSKYVSPEAYVVKVLDHHVEAAKHNLKGAPIVVAGGYGVGSKEGFDQLFQLAKVLHGEVGGSRAAVDAGWLDHDRQIGQTGVTVHPKVYIACGISGQIQHIAGMQDAGIIISINSDPEAPINAGSSEISSLMKFGINGTAKSRNIRMNAIAESIAVIVRYLAFTPVFTLLFVVTLFVLISFTPFFFTFSSCKGCPEYWCTIKAPDKTIRGTQNNHLNGHLSSPIQTILSVLDFHQINCNTTVHGLMCHAQSPSVGNLCFAYHPAPKTSYSITMGLL